MNDPVSDCLIVTVEDDRREKQVLGCLRLDLSDVLDRTRLYFTPIGQLWSLDILDISNETF